MDSNLHTEFIQNGSPKMLKIISDLASFVANILTIFSSALVLYLFLSKRQEISGAFKLLINYSYQTTLSDLRAKLERLNEYNVNEATEIDEIKNILHEISGQIRGNKRLKNEAPDLAQKFETLANGKKLTEPNKRSLVSETREVLRNIGVDNFEDLMGSE